MKNKMSMNQKILTDLSGIAIGVLVIVYPEMTINKFGFGYPGNLIIGILHIFVFGVLIFKHIKEKKDETNKE